MEVLGALAGFLVVILLIILAIYIAIAVFLNKFNKLVYGKGTAKSWIPIANVYLLGKLTVNKFVGWILVACIILTGRLTITVNGIKTVYTLLPESINSIVSSLYNITVIVLFIYAIVKYNKLKKNK